MHASALLLALAAALAPDAQPARDDSAAPAAQAPKPVDAAQPEWFEGSLDELFARAAAERRPVFVHFWAPWSHNTQLLLVKTYKEQVAREALAPYLCYAVDVTSAEGKPIAERFAAERPTRMLVFDADGRVLDFLGDISDPVPVTADALARELARIARGEGTLPALEAALVQAPGDLELRFALASKLRTIGDDAGFAREVAALRARDPEGKSRPLRTLELEELSAALSDPRAQAARKRELAAKLRAFVEAETDTELACRAWQALGTYHSQSAMHAKTVHDHAEARAQAPEYVACWQKALALAEPGEVELLGPYVAIMIYELRDYLKEEHKAFALAVTTPLIERKPEDVDLMDAHACALYLNGRAGEAIDLLKRAKQIDPSNWILQERIKAFAE